MPDAIFEQLQAHLTGIYAGGVVSDGQFLVSGFESDVYTFTLQMPGRAAAACILRLFPGDGSCDKLIREARGLSLLHQAGYPVPAMLFYEPDSAVLGSPFTVMEKLEGQPLWPVLAGSPPERANLLLDRFAGLQARLHQLDWRPFSAQAGLLAARPGAVLDDWLATSRGLFAQFAVGGFLPVLNWLEEQRKAVAFQPAVVHLDFHANNVFLGRDDRLAVIDWTQIAVADFRADLSWTLMIMGDFGQPAWGERILRSYEHARGAPVDDLDFFNLISYTKLLSSSVISLRGSPKELGMRPESAQTLQQQRPTLALLSQRIRRITGLAIPEVERLLDA